MPSSLSCIYSNISACFLIPVQVLPEGIEAVNGSSTDMGCTSALVDSGDVMTCNSQSYLVDGCSPDIDTSTSDWAFQLVTVRRNEGTAAVPIPHVLLTFGFDTAVSLTGIEIDLFHCPDWGIGAELIRVYLNGGYNLAFNFGLPPFRFVQPSQSSCDSLTTVHLSGDTLSVSSYLTFHIIMDLSHQSSIEWVHIGDVRFLSGGGSPATGTCLPTSLPPSYSTSLPSSSPSPSASSEYISATLSPKSKLQPSVYSTTTLQPESESSLTTLLHSSMPLFTSRTQESVLTSLFHLKFTSNIYGK